MIRKLITNQYSLVEDELEPLIFVAFIYFICFIQQWIPTKVRTMNWLGSIWFHSLTLYAVIICYLPHVKLFFYSKKFSNRSQKLYYAVLHISVLVWSTSVTYLFTESIYRLPYFLTHITLFISLFVAALTGSIKISRYRPLGFNYIRVAKTHQKRLYSFILYSYSIEFITLPMFGKQKKEQFKFIFESASL
uniref:Uncharacterized protein n=1 Tax=Wuchereria bancrofti TaxID=6293 RepID=A0AAF5Q477_WUCBA